MLYIGYSVLYIGYSVLYIGYSVLYVGYSVLYIGYSVLQVTLCYGFRPNNELLSKYGFVVCIDCCGYRWCLRLYRRPQPTRVRI